MGVWGPSFPAVLTVVPAACSSLHRRLHPPDGAVLGKGSGGEQAHGRGLQRSSSPEIYQKLCRASERMLCVTREGARWSNVWSLQGSRQGPLTDPSSSQQSRCWGVPCRSPEVPFSPGEGVMPQCVLAGHVSFLLTRVELQLNAPGRSRAKSRFFSMGHTALQSMCVVQLLHGS